MTTRCKCEHDGDAGCDPAFPCWDMPGRCVREPAQEPTAAEFHPPEWLADVAEVRQRFGRKPA